MFLQNDQLFFLLQEPAREEESNLYDTVEETVRSAVKPTFVFLATETPVVFGVHPLPPTGALLNINLPLKSSTFHK